MNKEISKILIAGTEYDIRDSRFDEASQAETARQETETARQEAEQGRVTAEQQRADAEAARAEEFATFEGQIAAKEDAANKVTSIGADADDQHYPSAKAVADYYNAQENDTYTALLERGGSNIFTIKGSGRLNNGTASNMATYNRTPKIAIDAIKGARVNGIILETGTFRVPALNYISEAVFFDAKGELLSYYSGGVTYSTATPFPASAIPQEAAFVEFNQYNNNAKVVVKGLNLAEQFKRLMALEEISVKIKEMQFVIPNITPYPFSDLSHYGMQSGAVYTIDGDVITFPSGHAKGNFITSWISGKSLDDKYYIGVCMKATSSTNSLRVSSGTTPNHYYIHHSGSGEWEWLSVCSNVRDNMVIIAYWLSTTQSSTIGDVSLKNPVVINLTQAFGKGNEPSKEEMDKLFIDTEVWFGASKTIYESNGLNADTQNRRINDLLLLANSWQTEAEKVITPQMDVVELVTALNAKIKSYAALNKCAEYCMDTLSSSMSMEEICEHLNHNFREDVVNPKMSALTFCDRVNSAFEKRVLRFCDAKVPQTERDFSLNTGLSAGEPSAIVGNDGKLYIYAYGKRISTENGINWSSAEKVNLSSGGEITNIVHCSVNIIDGTYYMIGTNSHLGGDYCMFTSTDGLNFSYAGKLFLNGHIVADGVSVTNFGNPYLIRDAATGIWYLYYEYSSNVRGYEISLAYCTNIHAQNADGTIGDWEEAPNNPILPYRKINGSVATAGNLDFAKLSNNYPIKCNGRYYIYYHSTWKAKANIRRAWSEDLIHWNDEGIILDIRDIPTNGDDTSGNADHCVIEYKGRTYMFYTWDINSAGQTEYIKYVVDDRPLSEILKLRP